MYQVTNNDFNSQIFNKMSTKDKLKKRETNILYVSVHEAKINAYFGPKVLNFHTSGLFTHFAARLHRRKLIVILHSFYIHLLNTFLFTFLVKTRVQGQWSRIDLRKVDTKTSVLAFEDTEFFHFYVRCGPTNSDFMFNKNGYVCIFFLAFKMK